MLVGWYVGMLVRPHIALKCFFSAVCGRIDLKFGGKLQVNLHFLFLCFFLLSSSSKSFSKSSSSFTLELEFICIYEAKQHIMKGRRRQKVYTLDLDCIEGPKSSRGPETSTGPSSSRGLTPQRAPTPQRGPTPQWGSVPHEAKPLNGAQLLKAAQLLKGSQLLTPPRTGDRVSRPRKKSSRCFEA
jgi:hypothetical protein